MKKKKIGLIISIIVLILLIFLLGTFYIANKIISNNYETIMQNIIKQNKECFKDYNQNIEYLDKWTYEDILNNLVIKDNLAQDTEIIIYYNDHKLLENEEILFDNIGNITLKVIFQNNFKYRTFKEMSKDLKTSKDYNIKVSDTIIPVISGVKDKETTVNNTIDIKEGITAYDEREGNIEVTIEGEVDFTKVGSYPVKAIAIDHNGNRVEEDFMVTVKEKPKTTTSTPKPSTPSNSNTKPSTSSGSSTCATSKSVLTKRGYKSTDQDACKKDKEASVIAKQIASEVLAKGYTKDIDKVGEAASIVSSYYYKGVHVESGLDYRTPYGVFVKGESSCAGATRALGQVLDELGYSWTHANENAWTHQWVILEMDGQIGYADGQVGMVGYGKHPASE